MRSEGLGSVKIYIWFFITLLIGTVEGSVGTFFPIVYVEKGGSLSSLGFIVGIVSLGGSLQVIWGRIIDYYRVPKKVAISSLLVNSISSGVMGISTTAGVYGTGRVGNTIGTSTFNNGNSYLRTAYFSSKSRGRIGNIFMGLNLIGVSLGVFLAGLFYDTYGFSSSIYVHFFAAVLGLTAALLYAYFLPEFNPNQIKDEQLSLAILEENANLNYGVKDTIRLMKKSDGLILFILGSLIFHFAVGISGPYFIVDLSQRWQFNNIEIASIMTYNSLIQVIVIFLAMPIVDLIDRKKLFTFGVSFAIIPVIAITLPPSLVSEYFGLQLGFWFIVYGLSSIGWGCINGLMLTLLIDYTHPKIRGSIIGIYGTCQAILTFLAASLSGLLLRYVFESIISIFILSIIVRSTGLIVLLLTKSPPIPMADFEEQRRIFATKFMATIERGILWIPVVGKILIKNKIIDDGD